MYYGQVEYRATITLVKFLITFLGLSTAGIAVDFPETLTELQDQWPIFVVSVLAALWRAYRNWLGNGGPAALKRKIKGE